MKVIRKVKPKVIVTRAIPKVTATQLEDHFLVEYNFSDKAFSENELKVALQSCDGLLCTVSDQITSLIMACENRLATVISNYGVGVSNIDINFAKTTGLVVTNTPNVLTEATAEIALFLLLSTSRRASYLEAKLRSGLWSGFSIIHDLGSSLRGKTLGVIGMGRIGRSTAQKAIQALGMKVIFFNRSKVMGLEFDAEQMETLDELVVRSDVVSMHAPGGGSTPILSAEHFAKMKKSSFLINTARGDVIDQQALISALKNGIIAGAGLDVYLNEPEVPKELISLPNVTLLPHIGSATVETREAMGLLAVKNLIAHFSDQDYPSRVV